MFVHPAYLLLQGDKVVVEMIFSGGGGGIIPPEEVIFSLRGLISRKDQETATAPPLWLLYASTTFGSRGAGVIFGNGSGGGLVPSLAQQSTAFLSNSVPAVLHPNLHHSF